MNSTVAAVEASSLYRRLSVAHTGVEVWPDEGFSEGGWSYAWIVARSGEGVVRNLAYIRLRDDQLQHRTYDDAGDDHWLPAE
jgi:hypothetical protein